MKSHKRFLALLLAAALTVPAGAPAEFPGVGFPEDGGEMPEDEWLAAERAKSSKLRMVIEAASSAACEVQLTEE